MDTFLPLSTKYVFYSKNGLHATQTMSNIGCFKVIFSFKFLLKRPQTAFKFLLLHSSFYSDVTLSEPLTAPDLPLTLLTPK